MSQTKLDPYTAAAENDSVSPQEKLDALKDIVKACHHGMLTTRSGETNALHSRAMHPAGYDDLHFYFIANNASYKFDEIAANKDVNISFIDKDSTNWASISGKARVHNDKELIKKFWSNYVSGYFADLGDGVHNGTVDDPRVSVIEVIPDEIRYWVANKGRVGMALEHAKGALTGKLTAPGEIRTITAEEIRLFESVHGRK